VIPATAKAGSSAGAVRAAGPMAEQASAAGASIGPAMTTERTRIERYDPTAIEPRWQERWAELGLYRTDLGDASRSAYYLLTMYDYPSGTCTSATGT